MEGTIGKKPNQIIELSTGIEQDQAIPKFQYDPYNVEVPPGMQAPFRVNLETNTICNMPCGFCFADYLEGPNAHEGKGLPTDREKLSTAEAKAMIFQAAQIGSTQFLLGGGDPFIRKDTPQLISYAHELGLQVVVDTNGLLLAQRPAVFEQVAPLLHQLGLSLDGSSAEAHDTFRETAHSFERVMRLIEWSRERDYKLKINTIVTAANMHDIPAMVQLLAPHADSIDRWSLDQFIPVNRGKQNKERYQISDADYLSVVNQVHALTDGRFANCTIGGGLKSVKAGTVMMFGPQGIPYVTYGDEKHHLPVSIRKSPLYELVEMAEGMHLDLHRMNDERFAQDYYSADS